MVLQQPKGLVIQLLFSWLVFGMNQDRGSLPQWVYCWIFSILFV